MRLELVRITADWLKDTTYGVNAKIPGVERDAGDAVPPLIADWTPESGPATIAVFDETRHDWVARKQAPPARPALYVMAEGGVDLAGEVGTYIRDTTRPAVVIIRYVSDKADRAVQITDAEYTLRAVVRSLRELMRNANVAARTRNNVAIELMQDPVTLAPVIEAVGEYRVTGAVVVNYQARDCAP